MQQPRYAKTLAILFITLMLSGCMGRMGLTGLVTQGNLKVVDNRFARAGLYILLSPVYGITATADLFIFNSIEFWTGRNPITHQKALVDSKTGTLIDLGSADKPKRIDQAMLSVLNEETIEMLVTYRDGSVKKLRGVKQDDRVHFYLDDEFITTASLDEIKHYVAARS